MEPSSLNFSNFVSSPYAYTSNVFPATTPSLIYSAEGRLVSATVSSLSRSSLSTIRLTINLCCVSLFRAKWRLCIDSSHVLVLPKNTNVLQCSTLIAHCSCTRGVSIIESFSLQSISMNILFYSEPFQKNVQQRPRLSL